MKTILSNKSQHVILEHEYSDCVRITKELKSDIPAEELPPQTCIHVKKRLWRWTYASGTKAPLVQPVGLFGRGLSVDLPPLLVPVDSEASGSEDAAWPEGAGTPDFFTFFFLLALWKQTVYAQCVEPGGCKHDAAAQSGGFQQREPVTWHQSAPAQCQTGSARRGSAAPQRN